MYYFACFLCFLHVVHTAPLERVMIDMSYPYDNNVQNYPLWKKFNLTVVMNGSQSLGVWVQGEEMTTATHIGTHMDSPSHFVPGGINIDQVSLKDLIAPAAVINIVAKASEDREAMVTVEDLEAWESTTGQTLDGKIVLINSGWGSKWNNREEFIGTSEEDPTKLRFPGISAEASHWLVDNRSIKGVGVDTLSIDIGSSPDFPSHRIILGKGLYALENVANVDKIPIYGALLHVFPMKISRSSGAPTRIIATYPKVIYDNL